MQKLADAISVTFLESVARDIVLVMVVGGVVALSLLGKPIPTELSSITTFVLGFFFSRVVTNFQQPGG